jgi:hypothetical protein
LVTRLGCFRDHEYSSRSKTLDPLASFGDVSVMPQATWGMSANVAQEFGIRKQ